MAYIAAEVTRGAIYCHFENKSDLFNALCERVRSPLETMQAADSELFVDYLMGRLLRNKVQVMRQVAHDPRSRRVFDILFFKCEYVEPDDLIVGRQRECFMNGKEKIKRILSEAVALHQLTADLDINLAYVMVQAAFSGMLPDWLFCTSNCDLSRDTENLCSVTMHALRTPPTLRKRTSAE